MPMLSDQSPANFNDPLPDRVDVVIIGGGVAGVSTAWFLAKAGVSVLICEKGRVAGEQSSRNWGWVRQQGRDAAELPIMMDSINSWESIAREVGDEIGFSRQGILYLGRNESELAESEKWLDVARPHQLDSRMISAKEVEDLMPDAGGRWKGALYTPSDGRAEPFTAVPAMARHLVQQGVAIRENCAVRSLDVEAGKVSGVITEHGRVRAGSVVCAGGAWSTVFLGNLNVKLPQLTVRSTVARTQPGPDVFSGAAAGGGVAIRRRADGGYTIAPGGLGEHFLAADSFRYFFKYLPVLRRSSRDLHIKTVQQFVADDSLVKRLLPTRHWSPDDTTPFEKNRVLNPTPSPGGVVQMRNQLQKYMPALGEVPFIEAWAGMIDVTPDVVPVMDQVEAYPGLYIATGFSGHGFGFGPGAGRVMANMVLGKQSEYDLKRFRLSRFTDGSKMIPGPGL
ncbi:MAG: FAD-binding oxidoreductase [bacterium]|nr:FAD-binding oxidoreductase [Gammaproteobacteria bacterium]HIL95137.1 FAD-binding oxidoreductase [Pseudomonadales bacterium]